MYHWHVSKIRELFHGWLRRPQEHEIASRALPAADRYPLGHLNHALAAGNFLDRKQGCRIRYMCVISHAKRHICLRAR